MSLVSRALTICLIACAAAYCLGGRAAQAQAVGAETTWRTTTKDSLLAVQVLDGLKCSQTDSVSKLTFMAAACLCGQSYVAGTLEEYPQEQLSIYLTRTDCILFAETCLALARTAKAGGGFPELAEELRQSRYRDGRVTAYSDRLHYTSEWILQGERRGTLKEITAELGGVPYDHPVSYMSTHPEAYPRMDDVAAIRSAEERINAVPVCMIPKTKVADALPEIRPGDILCLVSGIEGLDILHVGIAARRTDGAVLLIHASSAAGKVVVDPSKPLDEYLAGRKSVVGLRVLRPLD